MSTDVGVEIDNIDDGHVFSETPEVYAFHIGEICMILDFVYHLLITLCYLGTCLRTTLSELYGLWLKFKQL